MGCGAGKQVSQPERPSDGTARPSIGHKRRRSTNGRPSHARVFTPIPDRFKTLEDVTRAIRETGLESSNLIIGVDFTKSNVWTGAKSFEGRSLHDLWAAGPNPYQRTIDIVSRTLSEFDDDQLVPAYGFGDNVTRDRAVFPFIKGRPCRGVEEVLEGYRKAVKKVQLAGPTSFGPIIREACRCVDEEGTYCILIIVADGKVSSQCKQDTANAIVAATKWPLSIVMIGVGDGPWDDMNEFDDSLPDRAFDNFQFVEFNAITGSHCDQSVEVQEAQFALQALMEIPDQYQEILRLGLLSRFDEASSSKNKVNSFFMDDDSWVPEETQFAPKKMEWWQQGANSEVQATGVPQQGQGGSPLFDMNESLDGDISSKQFQGQQLGGNQSYGEEMPSSPSNKLPPCSPSQRLQNISSKNLEDWECPSCTCLNKGSAPMCGACKHAKPDKYDSLYTDSSGSLAPPYFLCPITQDIMKEPVMAEDGYVYEKAEISKWIKQKSSGPRSMPLSPMSGKPMRTTLIPNHSLRSEILEWLEQQKVPK